MPALIVPGPSKSTTPQNQDFFGGYIYGPRTKMIHWFFFLMEIQIEELSFFFPQKVPGQWKKVPAVEMCLKKGKDWSLLQKNYVYLC